MDRFSALFSVFTKSTFVTIYEGFHDLCRIFFDFIKTWPKIQIQLTGGGTNSWSKVLESASLYRIVGLITFMQSSVEFLLCPVFLSSSNQKTKLPKDLKNPGSGVASPLYTSDRLFFQHVNTAQRLQ